MAACPRLRHGVMIKLKMANTHASLWNSKKIKSMREYSVR